jgi:hypothetical protein
MRRTGAAWRRRRHSFAVSVDLAFAGDRPLADDLLVAYHGGSASARRDDELDQQPD